jgi:hypothetical protein
MKINDLKHLELPLGKTIKKLVINKLNNTTMKKKDVNDKDYLHVINCAIANAVFEADTQVIFDGKDFHWEEVVCQEFIRGYVIKHSDYVNELIPEGNNNGEEPNDFQNWLTDQLFYHANKCWEYFQDLKTKNKKL